MRGCDCALEPPPYGIIDLAGARLHAGRAGAKRAGNIAFEQHNAGEAAALPQYRDAGAILASAAPGLGLDGLGTARLEKHVGVRGAAFAAC